MKISSQEEIQYKSTHWSGLLAIISQQHAGAVEQNEECKSIKLPTGEVLYDPMDCGPKLGK